MKTILLFLAVCLVGYPSFSQCGKNTVLVSSKTEYLDASGTLQRTVEETSTIEMKGKELIIVPGSEERKMAGVIVSETCEWKVPFKEGKSIIKATFSRGGGEPATMNATLTIEGKDGKVVFTMEIAERPDRKIRVLADKFEEKS